VPGGGAQRVSRAVSSGFMEMLREQQAAIEGGAGWADVAALLQADPRLQARRLQSGDPTYPKPVLHPRNAPAAPSAPAFAPCCVDTTQNGMCSWQQT